MKFTEWLKNNPWLVSLLTIAGMVLTSFGIVKFTVKQNTGQEPEIIFIVNSTMPDGPQELLHKGNPVVVERKSVLHPLFLARCKVLAARELAKEKQIRFIDAYKAVDKVETDKIAAYAMDIVDINAVGTDGPIKRLVDWLSDPANQEKIKSIIAFIMGLAVLFV